jgi:hypothetical protein
MWIARFGVVVGLLFFPLALGPYNALELVLCGLGIIVFCVVGVPLEMMSITGSGRLVGKTIKLTVDDVGVRGWPIAEDLDRRWDTVRRVWVRGGTIIIPFRSLPGSRKGWVVIPEAGLSPSQLSELKMLLRAKGLLRR